LWQAPVFLVGLVALSAAWCGKPMWPDCPAHQLDRDLTSVRRLISQPDGDAREAVDVARRAVEATEQRFPDRGGEATFLLGSALIRLAERSTPAEAGQLWGEAVLSLEEAERRGVPEADRSPLLYRMAKVGFYTNADPNRVVEQLEESAAEVEELAASGQQPEPRGEAYFLLTRAYLRLQPPKVEEALKANTKLRMLYGVGEDILAPAQLLYGEMQLGLKRPAEARKVLERIDEQAPPACQAQASSLLARTYFAESRWDKAAALWKKVLEDPKVTLPDASLSRYQLGICYCEQKDVEEAAHIWEKCLQEPGGEEVVAAALQLSALRASGAHPESALETLEMAVRNLNGPDQWKNTLIDLEKARAVFEEAIQVFRKKNLCDDARKAVELYQKLAVPLRAKVLRADVGVDCALEKRRKARLARPGESLKAEEDAARELLVRAGDEYGEMADLDQPLPDRLNNLWLCANCYLDGQDFARAAARYAQIIKSEEKPDRKGAALFHQAEALRQMGDRKGAEKAFLECIAHPTPLADQARYELARGYKEAGQLDAAELMLEKTAELLGNNPDRSDSLIQEKVLFALGKLYHERKKYNLVEPRLRRALQLFEQQRVAQKTPVTFEETQARYLLADSFRQLATQYNVANYNSFNNEEVRKNLEKEHQERLLKAADEFGKLASRVEDPEVKEHLPPAVWAEVLFARAECLFDLGKYQEALPSFEAQLEANRGAVQKYQTLAAKKTNGDEYQAQLQDVRFQFLNLLRAYSGIIRCHARLQQYSQAIRVLNECQLDFAKASGSLSGEERDVWQEWIDKKAAPNLQRPPASPKAAQEEANRGSVPSTKGTERRAAPR
jgi:tetratricopeptide (TPR) repeat protein